MLQVETFISGPFETNCYVLFGNESDESVIIDAPPASTDALVGFCLERGLRTRYLILTHGHWDHIASAREIASKLACPIVMHESDLIWLDPQYNHMLGVPPVEKFTAQHPFKVDEPMTCGNDSLSILHLPGHTEGHIGILSDSSGLLFAGDVIFHGSIGRTDLPGGNYSTLLRSITTSILSLDDSIFIYPGHGPKTTIGAERESNPFIIDYLSNV